MRSTAAVRKFLTGTKPSTLVGAYSLINSAVASEIGIATTRPIIEMMMDPVSADKTPKVGCAPLVCQPVFVKNLNPCDRKAGIASISKKSPMRNRIRKVPRPAPRAMPRNALSSALRCELILIGVTADGVCDISWSLPSYMASAPHRSRRGTPVGLS